MSRFCGIWPVAPFFDWSRFLDGRNRENPGSHASPRGAHLLGVWIRHSRGRVLLALWHLGPLFGSFRAPQRAACDALSRLRGSGVHRLWVPLVLVKKKSPESQ